MKLFISRHTMPSQSLATRGVSAGRRHAQVGAADVSRAAARMACRLFKAIFSASRSADHKRQRLGMKSATPMKCAYRCAREAARCQSAGAILPAFTTFCWRRQRVMRKSLGARDMHQGEPAGVSNPHCARPKPSPSSLSAICRHNSAKPVSANFNSSIFDFGRWAYSTAAR